MKIDIAFKLLKNDLKYNKIINLTLFLFLFVAALLMASACLVVNRLSGSVNHLLNVAQPPHFLQMHIGEYNKEKIVKFANETNLVKKVQVQDMTNIEGVNIGYKKKSGAQGTFSESILDNYFVIQNKDFDYLLNTNNQMLNISPGEIAIPIVYAKKYGLATGDKLYVISNDLKQVYTIVSTVRDAQMGSSLASSIRFLINPVDFKTLYAKADRQEAIIGFRLYDVKKTTDFQAMYTSESFNMPQNGVSITYDLIKLVNNIGDGLMSGVILLVSFIIMGIALLNMRFTLLATLQDEVRQIGTFKAIGFKHRDITDLYLIKYRLLTGFACFLAVIVSFPVSQLFMQSIALNFGLCELTIFSYFSPFVSVVFIYLIVMGSLRCALKSIKKLTVIDVLVEGQTAFKKRKKVSFKIPKLKYIAKNIDFSMSLHAYRTNYKSWLLLSFVFFLSTLIILLPLNLWMTMRAPDFVKYMGAVNSDIYIGLQYNPNLANAVLDIEQALKSSSDVERYSAFYTVQGKIHTQRGAETLAVEVGNYQEFKINMEEGRLPREKNEIILSYLNAKKLNKQVGDRLTVVFLRQTNHFTVTGIYQDITNGGYTAKTSETLTDNIMRYTYFVDLKLTADDAEMFIEKFSLAHRHARVIKLDTFIAQTFGAISNALRTSIIAVFIITMCVISLIVVLFISLTIYRQRSQDSVMLAIGFKKSSVRSIYLYQSGLSIIIGIVLGALFSLWLGESIVSVLFSAVGLGITKMRFIIDPTLFILFGCFIPLTIGTVSSWLVTRQMGGLHF